MVARQALRQKCFPSACARAGHSDKERREIDDAFARFKDLADRKVQIFDEDIQSLFDAKNIQPQEISFVL